MPVQYTICFRRVEGCERFHCAFPPGEYCGNTKEKGGTRMSDHKGFSVGLTKILLVSILLLLIPLFSSPAGMGVSASSTQPTTVRFDVVAFDLPGPGWQQTTATARQVGYTRKMGDGKSQSIAFWPVTFPPSLQGRSQQEHTSAYFDIERQKPRYEGRWEGFVEGAREIAGRQFPTMSSRSRLRRSDSSLAACSCCTSRTTSTSGESSSPSCGWMRIRRINLELDRRSWIPSWPAPGSTTESRPANDHCRGRRLDQANGCRTRI